MPNPPSSGDVPFARTAQIDRTRERSTPAWMPRAAAAVGAPNIVIIYMDDMGFSDPGCFGGEIDTPHIDSLAARGLRFNHYTTHPAVLAGACRAADRHERARGLLGLARE